MFDDQTDLSPRGPVFAVAGGVFPRQARPLDADPAYPGFVGLVPAELVRYYCPAPLTIEPPISVPAARIGARRWQTPLFFASWTVFAALVAGWLIHSAGAERIEPQLLFDSNQAAQTPVPEQIRRWLTIADLNFRGAYPWVLLAPYVLWLGSRFLIERGRLRLSLPVHLVACALFVAASHGLTKHAVEKLNVMMVMSDPKHRLPLPWDLLTNEPDAKLTATVREEMLSIHTSSSHGPGIRTKVVMATDGDVKTFELPPQTNGEHAATAQLAHVEALITNWNSGARAILDPARRELEEGFRTAAGAGGFSSWRSSWSYESRWFSGLLNVLAYGSLVGLAHAVYFYRHLRERERRAVLLESHLAKARLHALQARLQPHFLFNALNAVATLLRRDTRAAQEALTSFSELLRLALSQSDKQEVPLREDLEFVERYVEIQQTRLGDRLRFEQDVDPIVLDCLVPALLLQPLVENALRHGIELSSKPGLVRVVVRRLGTRLALRVEDNGVGLTEAGVAVRLSAPDRRPDAYAGAAVAVESSARSTVNTGIGLSNLRARLETLYGNEQKAELLPRPEGGVVMHIEIPLRYEAPGTANRPKTP